MGFNAGSSLTTATNSTIIGAYAGSGCTTSSNNTLVGRACGNVLTSADNVMMGNDSGLSTTTGAQNVFLGNRSGRLNTIGHNTVSIGYDCMAMSANSTQNVFVGCRSGYYMGTGVAGSSQNNVGIGYQALFSSNLNSGCVAVGMNALLTATVDNAVGIGLNALQALTTGSGNIGVGYNSGASITTSTNNICIGNNAGPSATGSNNLYLGPSSGSGCTTGSNNIFIQTGAVTTDTATIRIGDSGVQTRTYIAGIRGITTVNANGVAVLIDSLGNLGTVSSLTILKENISDYNLTENNSKIMSLKPKRFNFKSDESKTLTYGLMVEDVIKTIPDLISHDSEGNPETIMYQHIPILNLTEIQRLNYQLIEMTKIVESLSERLSKLEQK